VVEKLMGNPAVRVVKFETLCAQPKHELEQLFAHCHVKPASGLIDDWAPRVSAPDYYESALSASDRQKIADITGPVAERL
jgi:hypothetical protein